MNEVKTKERQPRTAHLRQIKVGKWNDSLKTSDVNQIWIELHRIVSSHPLVRASKRAGFLVEEGKQNAYTDLTQELFVALLSKDRFQHYIDTEMSDAEIEAETPQSEARSINRHGQLAIDGLGQRWIIRDRDAYRVDNAVTLWFLGLAPDSATAVGEAELKGFSLHHDPVDITRTELVRCKPVTGQRVFAVMFGQRLWIPDPRDHRIISFRSDNTNTNFEVRIRDLQTQEDLDAFGPEGPHLFSGFLWTSS